MSLAAIGTLSLASVAGMALQSWYYRFCPLVAAGVFAHGCGPLPFPVARSMEWLPLGFLTQHGMQLALAVTLPALFFPADPAPGAPRLPPPPRNSTPGRPHSPARSATTCSPPATHPHRAIGAL
ncbi:MAG: hypothetical protein IPK34_09555 [Ramlibacter sp.]|nr:hypothetical protein [Ramlibacter sp.]